MECCCGVGGELSGEKGLSCSEDGGGEGRVDVCCSGCRWGPVWLDVMFPSSFQVGGGDKRTR